jgi:hypothetical protein
MEILESSGRIINRESRSILEQSRQFSPTIGEWPRDPGRFFEGHPMNIRRSAAVLALIVSVSGCSVSEHGICPKDGGDQAVFDPALLGDWVIVADDSSGPKDGPKVNVDGGILRFARREEGSKTYLIGSPAEPGQAAGGSPTTGHLVPIGEARFLDVLAGDPKDKGGQRHLLFKVSKAKEDLIFQAMNPAYFASHPKAISTSSWSISGGSPARKSWLPEISIELPMITSPTPELRKFLEEHANDQELWPADWTVKLRHPEAEKKTK